MLRVQPIESLELPELAIYRTMRWQYEQRQQGIFVAEGEKVVRRLLESELELVSLLMPEKWLRVYEPLLAKRREKIVAYTAEKELLQGMVGYSMYQGVLAAARVPKMLTVEEALAGAQRPCFFLAVDEIALAENMGGLVRNCAAFGVQALLLDGLSCSPYLRRAVRASMGTVFKLPVIETASLAESLEFLRGRGVSCVAAHPRGDGRMLSQADFTGDCCIVLGSEGKGISRKVLEACDEAVMIPMQNEVDSLNVGTAGAVFLYEASRQRGRS